ncbi:Copper transport protein ctr4 [Diplodia seriata]|uniref:Copper transport protein n=1 Tax=Diplodia seriata TaxID=420778 RepID=A0A1S8B8T1_9PEZI|nr:Copper transport protein ctr4 [Diplodia seriata]
MLWNWYTIDSCFIARSWHVRSAGAFAGSCIGVILLVVALEALRRAQRELDRYFRRVNGSTATSAPSHSTADASAAAAREEAGGSSSASSSGTGGGSGKGGLAAAVTGRGGGRRGMPVVVGGVAPLKWWQQLVRSALFMVQFAVGYFVMLLAMYYNGYIIICIFIGAFLGAAMFQWDTYYSGAE